MRERICKRCSSVGEWRKSRIKSSMYYKHYLCTLCSTISKSLAKKPTSDDTKKKVRLSRRINGK